MAIGTGLDSWYYRSSAGQVDLIGTPDRVSITATVMWELSYSTSEGVTVEDWGVHETTSQRDEIPVVEAHSIIIE